MNRLTAIALDDEPGSLEVIEQHAAKVDFMDLKATFTSPSKALTFLQENEIQVLFLDIEMPDINGLELARMLDRRATQVVFITAFPEYALEGFELQVADYLMKPLSFNRFMKACLKVKETYDPKQHEDEFIFVKDGYQLRKIRLEEIRYIKSDANLLNIHTTSERILTRMTISRIMEALPEDQFIRVHKSYIVNLQHIERVDQQFVNAGGLEIPISAAYRSGIQRVVGRFLKS